MIDYFSMQSFDDDLIKDGELLLFILQHEETFQCFFIKNFPVYIAVAYWLCKLAYSAIIN